VWSIRKHTNKMPFKCNLTIFVRMELWRKTEVDPNFEISSFGNIRRSNGKNKKQWKTNWGYMQTEFKNKKKHAVHRLVGFAFLKDSFFQGAVINHKDGNKCNNHVDNLEWVTLSENAKHSFRIGTSCIVGERHPSARLTEQKVLEIREKRKQGIKYRELAIEYGVRETTIADAAKGRNWSHI